jgi:hypothetical protein
MMWKRAKMANLRLRQKQQQNLRRLLVRLVLANALWPLGMITGWNATRQPQAAKA